MTPMPSSGSNSTHDWDARLRLEALRVQANCQVDPARVEALASELIARLRADELTPERPSLDWEHQTRLATRVLHRVLDPICGVKAANALLQKASLSLPGAQTGEAPLELLMVKASSLVGAVYGINAAHMVEAVIKKVTFELATGA